MVIEGDAGAARGVSMKGGLVVVGGAAGYMAGFMGQRGTLIVCGDAGEALGDSMYEAVCYVGGEIAGLGNDAVVEAPASEDARLAGVHPRQVPRTGTSGPRRARSRRIVSGRKLWNFSTKATSWGHLARGRPRAASAPTRAPQGACCAQRHLYRRR